MIEKVARNIFRELCKKKYHPAREDVINNEINKYWRAYIEEAKAAIQAMLEPTEEMNKSVEEGERPGFIWEKMIDAALKD